MTPDFKPNKRKLALFIILSLLIVPATVRAQEDPPQSAIEHVLILEGESLAGYSDTSGGAGDFSQYHRWLTSYGLKPDKSSLWIFTYNGSFDESQLFVAQEEGNRESNQVMTNNFNVSYTLDVKDDLSVRPFAYYDVTFVKETADEDLGEGLYDYEDAGGGVETTHLLRDDSNRVRSLAYTFSVYKRRYPHFSSLLASFDPNSTLEEKEKDYLGYKGDFVYESPFIFDTNGTLDYTIMYKDFTDKKTIDVNGIREAEGRLDVYHKWTGTISKTLTDNLLLLFDTTLELNTSNLDFYDTRNTATLADDRFFEDYYEYFAYSFNPTVVFFLNTHPHIKRRTEIQATYSLTNTYFHGREALDLFGTTRSEDQEDVSNTVSVRANVPLSKELTWILSASYAKYESNQEFETFYRYSYETWTALSGISFEY